MTAYIRLLICQGLALLLIATVAQKAAADTNFDPAYGDYDMLLKAHVTDGKVDYSGLNADPKQLIAFLDSAAGVTEARFRSWPEAGQLAFLINLYNAATLQLIVGHLPIKSIKEIGGFFKSPWSLKIVRLFGDTVTLNHLEHAILRKQYDEPRIHMALVCAAKSCPPLRSEAYVAERLSDQLDDQSRRFLSSAKGLVIDRKEKTVYVSSIFKWYGEDFVGKFSPGQGFAGLGTTQRAVANFAGLYAGPAAKAFLAAGGYSIRYIDYDWSLNAK